jgi:hypothetical protein
MASPFSLLKRTIVDESRKDCATITETNYNKCRVQSAECRVQSAECRVQREFK